MPDADERDVAPGAVPEGLADFALLDVRACAEAICASTSQWRALVAEGIAPQPVVRANRFTRWRAGDVREFLMAAPDLLSGNGAELSARADQARAARKPAGKSPAAAA